MHEAGFRKPAMLWLALILLLAAGLRFYGLNWDQNQHLHPDERFLTMVAGAVRWPAGITEYMDEARSPLNPRNAGFGFYVYGVLPVALVKALAEAAGIADYDGIAQAGRAASAAADLGTVLLVYLLGITLYRTRRVALFGAALYALSVASIQQAHFFVVDPFANFAVAGALLLAARYQKRGRLIELCAAGACLGLAAAAKLSVAPFAAVVVLVCVSRARKRRDVPLRAALESELFRAGCFMLAAFAVFRFAAPDVFAGPAPWNVIPAPRWLANVAEVGRMVSGEADVPPGHQWTSRTPLLFPWLNMVIWGMGVPLGLAAWAGFGLAARRVRRPAGARHLIPLAWTAIVFLQHGSQWAMTIRYFLPAYGCLCLLAAWALLRWRPLARRRWAAWAVAGGAALWALAFIQIYTRPHNRVTASEWIYANVPRGSAIANEHWDDALPLRMHGHDPFGGMYQGIELPWYHEDTREKLATVLDSLERAEWVILSSNRLSDSIPRLPARYPMTSRYYRALLDGSLGFEQAAVFDHRPGWLGLRLPTHFAEEAFSVYDHPRVRIFRKTAAYSRAGAERLLDIGRWDEVVRQSAREASRAPTAFMLTEPLWQRVKSAPGWTAMWQAGPLGRAAPWLPWLGWTLLMGAGAWPLLFVLAPGLPDRGYALARVFGLLLTSWLSWCAAGWGLAPFGPWPLIAALTLIGLAAAYALRWRWAEFRFFVAENWRLLLGSEVVFFGAFALMAAVRLSNPDLWHPNFGGEKPMDVAFLTATARSEWFPPHQPWFGGGFINYYYFGFVPAAALMRLTGLTPEIAYNVALPAWFALAAGGAYGVALALLPAVRRRAAFAAIAPLTVLLAGNLKQVQLVASRLASIGAGGEPGGGLLWIADALKGAARWLGGQELAFSSSDLYFRASRAIPHARGEVAPITEFPYFSFLYGDLHAHVLALPISLLCLGLIVSLARRRLDGWRGAFQLLLVALALGGVWAANTWEVPALAAALAAALWLGADQPCRPARAALLAASAMAAAWLAYLPYHRHRYSGYGSFEFWDGSRTPFVDYLIVYGLPLLPVAAAAALLLWRRRSAALAEPATRMAAIIAAAGFLLTLMVEAVVLQGDIGRSNTVFKFGIQAWVLLGIACAPAAAWFSLELGKRARRAAAAGGAVWLALGLFYPVTATPQRAKDRFDAAAPRTWDGLAFLPRAVWHVEGQAVPLAGDRAMIEWLRRNVAGNAVVAEWNTRPVLYSWGNRIANYTGFPSIVGWDWHLRQQMPGPASERVARRIDAVREIYETPDAARAAELLRLYEVRYVVAGALERALAPAAGLSKFEAGEGRYWDRVFYEGGDAIYRVRPMDGP